MQGEANGLKNNMKGNGFLSGGTLIVKKGGQEVILCYKQQELADHLGNSEILKALGLTQNGNNFSPVTITEPKKSAGNDLSPPHTNEKAADES